MPSNKVTYEATCSKCDRTESQYYYLDVHGPHLVYMPNGWICVGNDYVCNDHEISIDGVVVWGYGVWRKEETVDA